MILAKVTTVAKAKLRKELKAGYLRENEINKQLAEEWVQLEEEAFQKVEQQ